jgi:membrane-associated phospholipid phosphatase
MDLLKEIDAGAYYFFRFQASQHPEVVSVVQEVEPFLGYIAAVVLLGLTAVVCCVRGRPQAAAVSIAVFAVAVAAIEGLRHAIARRRPEDAQDMLGTADMAGSYPARGVFLLALTLLLLTFALAAGAPRWLRVLLSLAAALLIAAACVSQLFLGLHFVSDVLGGLLGGGACALLAWLLAAPRTRSIKAPLQAMPTGYGRTDSATMNGKRD